MLQNNSGFLGSIPMVTRNLLIINFLVFMADALLSTNGFMTRYLALFYFESDFFYPHQFITYMFMHGDFGHLFFNMFAVFMFGRTLEMVWGPKRFLTYYLLTGIGAAALQTLIIYIRLHTLEAEISPELLHAFYSKSTDMWGTASEGQILSQMAQLINVPMVGASGAVFGILVAFGMLFPNAELFLMFIPIPIKAKYFVIGYGVMELYLGFANNPGDNIAHFAHLGGLLTGLILVLYWKKKGTLNGNYF